MEEKHADNMFVTKKQQINEIDEKIDREKKKQKKIIDIQEELFLVNKNINNCIDLLSNSIKGPNTDYIFDDIHDSNQMSLIKTSNALEEEYEFSEKTINQLYDEKDRIIKEE